MKFLIRRAFHGIVLLFGISVLSFLLAQLAPGDFLAEMRLNAQISPETVAALRAQYGLDRPLVARYLSWSRSVLRGDLGFSFAYNSPVGPLLWPRVRNTLVLTVTSMVFAWLIALLLGIAGAARPRGWVDRACAVGSSTLLAVPDLVLALGFLLLALKTGLFPTGGMFSVGFEGLPLWARARDLAWHLSLPCAVLVLGTLPVLVRHLRAAMIETFDEPFVRTALAHGIPRRRVLWRQVLPAAANPLISLFGISIGTLLSSSLLVEIIMSWPGLGPLTLEAIFARDIHLVIGSIMVSTVCLVGGNLCADLLLYAVDPRIRKE